MGQYISPYFSLAILGTLMLFPLGIKDGLPFPKAIAQTRQQANTNRSAWQVALPQQATVWRKKGSSLTGKLVNFDPKTLTVAAGGDSEIVITALSGYLGANDGEDLGNRLTRLEKNMAELLTVVKDLKGEQN